VKLIQFPIGRIDWRNSMRKLSASFILEFFFVMIILPPLHAQTAARAPVHNEAMPANQSPTGLAPDDVMKKISDLVYAGKYTEAEGLTTGLLLAYPDDQRLIKAKALLEKSLASASSANAIPGGSQSPQPVTNTAANQITGMDKVDYSALVVLARQAQQTDDLPQQKKLLHQFMDQSRVFLEKHPDQMLLWQLRTASAIGLDDAMAGYEAGQKLLATGGADSDDPNLSQLLGQLKNKGWLDEYQAKNYAAVTEANRLGALKRSKYEWALGMWSVQVNWYWGVSSDHSEVISESPSGISSQDLRGTVLESGDMRWEVFITDYDSYWKQKKTDRWHDMKSCVVSDGGRTMTIVFTAGKNNEHEDTWIMTKK
jgi:hypothetical protein